jgi:hypothetical protein
MGGPGHDASRAGPPRRPSGPAGPKPTRITEPVAAFLVAAVVYLVVAALMAGHNIVFADAMSRVGNAYYVLFSRDPHLPAIGFVWNPLPSLVLLPLLPFRFLAPWLVSNGIARRRAVRAHHGGARERADRPAAQARRGPGGARRRDRPVRRAADDPALRRERPERADAAALPHGHDALPGRAGCRAAARGRWWVRGWRSAWPTSRGTRRSHPRPRAPHWSRW